MTAQNDRFTHDYLQNVRSRVAAAMDGIVADLAALVAYPSLAFEGFDPKPNLECAEAVRTLLEPFGFDTLELLDIGGPFPVVWAEHHSKSNPEAPVVLLYAHYDVQPAPVEEQGWRTNPWKLTLGADGRLYGRGAADDKGGIVQHVGALRVLSDLGELDSLNLKICIEGDEEAGGPLADYVEAHPDRFTADMYVIADVGNMSIGEPVVVSQLRGSVKMMVRVSTLEGALHSGMYGGAAPDAFVATARLVNSLFDDDGTVVVDGLASGEWQGAEYPADLFREQAGVLEGVALIGSGSVADQLWARPSITVLASSLPQIEGAANILIPSVTVELGVRFPPGQSAGEVAAAVEAHLHAHAPWGAHVEVLSADGWAAFRATEGTALSEVVSQSLTDAFDCPASQIGAGGSIPLLSALQQVSPRATFANFGPEDQEAARVHGGNESVSVAELERCIVAETLLLARVSS